MTSMPDKRQQRLIVGRISGVFGVRGEVKIFSYTRPIEQIFSYTPWYLQQQGTWVKRRAAQGSRRGKGLTAQIEGVNDRDAAQGLISADIAVDKEQLPALPEGEFYWHELIGLKVETVKGDNLGNVVDLEETGANDVLVLQGETKLLVPFVRGSIVKSIDLESGTIQVDWNPEFI